jgi:hypothetical protein
MILPLIFSTGYRVAYEPGGAAIPVIKPYPIYPVRIRTWAQWWRGEPAQEFRPGIAAFYLNNSAKYSVLGDSGKVPDFISPDLVPAGETCRQLTPEGSMRSPGL